jgi:hypothetical protein
MLVSRRSGRQPRDADAVGLALLGDRQAVHGDDLDRGDVLAVARVDRGSEVIAVNGGAGR